MPARGTSEADYRREAERMVTVMEATMGRFLASSPELQRLQQVVGTLFPYRREGATIVYGPSVIDRLDTLERKVDDLLAKVQSF